MLEAMHASSVSAPASLRAALLPGARAETVAQLMNNFLARSRAGVVSTKDRTHRRIIRDDREDDVGARCDVTPHGEAVAPSSCASAVTTARFASKSVVT